VDRPHKAPIVGQGIVEYELVVVLIAIVVIVLLATVGHQAQEVFSNLSRGLAT
jgi:Flp pilus assembly pilin Flp